MDLTPPPLKNVIALNAACAVDLEIKAKEQAKKYQCAGTHREIVVDEVTRTCTCRACGFTIDAFDYLNQWAMEGTRRMNALKSLDVQIRVSRAELEDLKRKLKNARQGLKRLGQPQTAKERMEWQQQVYRA